MRFNRLKILFLLLMLLTSLQFTAAQTIQGNQTGTQSGYSYEYWKDGGSGTMVLGTGGNFTCTWSCSTGNILFRKGVKPGSINQVVTFSATYNPSGNSYLTVYGWTKNPLVEYYIVDSWGSWKPPGSTSKGTLTSDGGTYDIYETSRIGQPSIFANKDTFEQYWSVRQVRRSSGTITCANHFNAWISKEMALGAFYEVAFNVEGYHSSGDANVTMSMSTASINTNHDRAKTIAAGTNGASVRGYLKVATGGIQTISFMVPVSGYVSLKFYDFRGKEVAELGKREYSAGEHFVNFNTANFAKGVYLYSIVNQKENLK